MSDENPGNVQLSNDQTDTGGGLGVCNYILVALATLLVVVTFPVSLLCSLKVLQEYERGIVLRLGRVVSDCPKGPGLIFVFPCIDELRIVDFRTFYYDIQPQKILTKDSLTVVVDAVVYARLINARQGALSGNIPLLTGRWTAAALCQMLGSKTLAEILGEREKLTKALKQTLYRASYQRGVEIERVEIKNVSMPPEMQRAMAVEAETSREAKAKVIAAKGEMEASRALKNASDIIGTSPAALKLRYLQTLNSIAAENNRTIVFPLPLSLFKAALSRRNVPPSRPNQPPKSEEKKGARSVIDSRQSKLVKEEEKKGARSNIDSQQGTEEEKKGDRSNIVSRQGAPVKEEEKKGVRSNINSRQGIPVKEEKKKGVRLNIDSRQGKEEEKKGDRSNNDSRQGAPVKEEEKKGVQSNINSRQDIPVKEEKKKGVRSNIDSRQDTPVKEKEKKGVRSNIDSRQDTPVKEEEKKGVRSNIDSRQGKQVKDEVKKGVRSNIDSRQGPQVKEEEKKGVRSNIDSRQGKPVKEEEMKEVRPNIESRLGHRGKETPMINYW